MAILAYFGINSSGLTLVIDLVILFAGVLYLSLIYWTFADARRRIADPALVGCATAASLFPFLGTIIYMVLRPPEYLEDVRERELEMQAAEARLYAADFELCPHCDYRIEREFIRCPSCLRKLKDRCVSCTKPLDRAWTICPYCETEVPVAPASGRSRRRRTTTEGQTSAAKARASSSLNNAKPRPSTRAAVPAARADDTEATASLPALHNNSNDSTAADGSPERHRDRDADAASPANGPSRTSRPRPTS